MFEEQKAWGREWALGKLQADPGRKAETKQPVQSCAGQLRLECGEVKKKGPAAIPAAQNKTVFKLLAKTFSTRYLNSWHCTEASEALVSGAMFNGVQKKLSHQLLVQYFQKSKFMQKYHDEQNINILNKDRV